MTSLYGWCKRCMDYGNDCKCVKCLRSTFNGIMIKEPNNYVNKMTECKEANKMTECKEIKKMYESIYKDLDEKGLFNTKRKAFFSGINVGFNIIDKMENNKGVIKMERTLDEVTIYVKTVKEICENKFLDSDESQCEKCSLKRIEEILGMR